MAALYGRFVKPGDLVFDIGSHVGDRIAAFRRLGCRVVAVEPQPAAFGFLRMAYGRRSGVTLVHAAVSDRPGTLSRQQNADVIAFILEANSWPAGKTELPSQLAALKAIRIEANAP